MGIARATAITYFVFEFNVLVQMLSSHALAFMLSRIILNDSSKCDLSLAALQDMMITNLPLNLNQKEILKNTRLRREGINGKEQHWKKRKM